MRHLAGTSATVLNDYRRELKGFAERQTALNGDIERGIQDFGELQLQRDAATEQRLLAVRVAGDKPTLDVYGLLTSRSAADVVSQSSLVRPAQSATPPPVVTFDSSTLERLTRQLNEFHRPRSYWEQLLRTVTFGTDLQQAYRASMGKANANARDADTQTVNAAQVLTNPNP